MLRILGNMPPGTVGVEATGKVTDEDYRTVLAPALEDGAQDRSLRLLYVLGDELDGHSPGAAGRTPSSGPSTCGTGSASRSCPTRTGSRTR